MKHNQVNYDDLRGVDPTYVEKLRRRETIIRQVLAEMGRGSTSVRWSCIDDGSRNYVFRLLAAEDWDDCILQVSPLNLALESEQFGQVVAQGKRTCVGTGHKCTTDEGVKQRTH